MGIDNHMIIGKSYTEYLEFNKKNEIIYECQECGNSFTEDYDGKIIHSEMMGMKCVDYVCNNCETEFKKNIGYG